VLLLVVLVIFHYDNSTAVPILILTLSLVPDNLTLVAQAILLGQRRFGPPAITMTLTSLFKLIGGGLVLASGGSLYQIAWVWLIGSILGMVLLLIIAVRGVGWLQRADWLDWRPLTRNWRAALPFVFITTMMTLEGQADVILLSTFRNEAEVGWYSAATTVAFSFAMLSQAYRMSVYPLMARYALQSPAKLSRLYEWSLHYLGVLILPLVTGVALLSPRIVLLVFGSKFQPTAKVLQVLILALVFMFLNVPNARIMLVKDRQGWNSLFLLGSVMSNLLLNLALDRPWGALGAAVARLFSSAIYFVLSYLYVVHFLTRVNLIKLLSKPMLATLMMAVAVLSVRTLPLPIPIGVGVVAYAGTLWLVRGVLPDGASAGLWRKAV
jgi:O-antigen/teichoic acid export membrane protein